MIRRINLDMDVLRTFVAGIELGSFAKAATRLGRSQSAISTQLRKLEDQAGQPLVRKEGRGLVLTNSGEALMAYAKRILALNDEAVAALQGAEIEGWVRLGLPQDFAESWLPAMLGQFARAHPKVRVEVRVDRVSVLIEHLLKGELDLALAWDVLEPTLHAEHIADVPIVWIAHPDWRPPEPAGSTPIPLLAFEAPCVFRSAATAALDSAGLPWRLAFSSPSLAGLWAASEAQLGLTVRSPIGVPERLKILDPEAAGLPALPTLGLSLHAADAEPTPAVQRLREIIRETVLEKLPAPRDMVAPRKRRRRAA